MDESVTDAHVVLNVKLDASAEEVRRAYLDLVRQYPPDQDAVKFRQIHAAYELLSDPLNQAQAIVTRPRERPNLSEIVASADEHRPRLKKLLLLALGNQDSPLDE